MFSLTLSCQLGLSPVVGGICGPWTCFWQYQLKDKWRIATASLFMLALSLLYSFQPFSSHFYRLLFLKIVFAVSWHGGIDGEVGVTSSGPHTLSPSTCDPFSSTRASPTPEALKHHRGCRTRCHPVHVTTKRSHPEEKNDSEHQAWARGFWPWALAEEQSSVHIMLGTSNMLERSHSVALWVCRTTCSVKQYSCAAWPCPQWNCVTHGLCNKSKSSWICNIQSFCGMALRQPS